MIDVVWGWEEDTKYDFRVPAHLVGWWDEHDIVQEEVDDLQPKTTGNTPAMEQSWR